MKFVHVIPDCWGAYVDIRACYQEYANRNPTHSVVTPTWFKEAVENQALESKVVHVLWDYDIDPGPREARNGAIVVPVYSEAIGKSMDSDEGMLPSHVAVRNRFTSFAQNFDAIFGHTPWMALRLREMTGLKSFVMPAGWNPDAMGSPRWSAPKHRELTFHGSLVGRRALFLPYLKEKLGGRLQFLEGRFGRALLGDLDTAKATLYVAHSAVGSYSTWRIWQTVATSCGLVSEPGDNWPMTKDHYVEIPELGVNNVDMVKDKLDEIMNSDACFNAALRSHSELGPEFTVDRCVEKFLVPAAQELL